MILYPETLARCNISIRGAFALMTPHTLARTLGCFVLGASALSLVFSFCSARNLDEASAAGLIPDGQQDSTASFPLASTSPRVIRTPVVVELFTSGDCAACPSVDSMLVQLEREQPISNARIIVLREHVDSSKDESSTDRALISDPNRRLKEYQGFFHLDEASLPKIVVNGTAEFGGSNLAKMKNAIERAATAEPIPLQIAAVKFTGHVGSFKLQPGMPTTPGYVNVYAAIVDSGDTTRAPAGAEEGQSPIHATTVPAFSIIGSSWRTDALGDGPFDLPGNWSATPVSLRGMRLIVFVQTKHIGPIRGVAFCDFAPGKQTTGELRSAMPAENRCSME
jgi:hypothetical protein